MDHLIAFDCIAIPDGLSADGSTLHACIQFQLKIDPTAGLQLSLENLPLEIQSKLEAQYELRLWQRDKGASLWTQVLPLRRSQVGLGSTDTEVESVWQQLMAYNGTPNGLIEGLYESFRDSSTVKGDAIVQGSRQLSMKNCQVPDLNRWHNNLVSTRLDEFALARAEQVSELVQFDRAEGALSLPSSTRRRWRHTQEKQRLDFWSDRTALYSPLFNSDSKYYFDRLYVNDDLSNDELVRLRQEFMIHNSAVFHEAATPLPETGNKLIAAKNKATLDELKNLASARYIGVIAHPRLATLLSLALNFDFDAAQFSQQEIGELWAEIVLRTDPLIAPSVGPLPTAYRLTTSDGGSFQPASQFEWDEASELAIDRGYINLKYKGQYTLRMCDVSRGMRGEFAQTANRSHAINKGSFADHDIDRPQGLKSPGIELVDQSAGEQLKALIDNVSKLSMTIESKGQPTDRYTADDLLVGYRVDIERTDRSYARRICATAMARKITYKYQSANGLKPISDSGWNRSHLRSRDDGSIRKLLRMFAEPMGGGLIKEYAFGLRELFTWTGDSLGLPSEDAGADPLSTGETASADSDLNLDVEYNFVNGDDGNIPILRIGDDYRVGMRACFLHGGGPKFSAAEAIKSTSLFNCYCLGQNGLEAAFLDREHINFSSEEQGLTFRSSDPGGAPQLAFRASDPLVEMPTDKRSNQQRIDRVVLYDESGITSAVRVLVPPRVPFDTAELQKQFDRSDENTPLGALRGIQRGPDGELPVVGRIPVADAAQQSEIEELPAAFGPVVRHGSVPKGAPPYYCDARGRTVVLSLTRNGVSCEDLPERNLHVDFWKQDEGPNNARPIAIRCRLKAGIKGARFGINALNQQIWKERIDGIEMTVVAIDVGEGDEFKVHAICLDCYRKGLFRENQLLRSASNRILMSKQFEFKSLDPEYVDDLVIDHIAACGSDLTCDVTTFNILSAVKKPLSAPTLITQPELPQGELYSVTRLIAATAKDKWANLIGGDELPPTNSHDPGGDVGYLAGQVSVRRRSTSIVRLEAAWRDFDDEVCLQNVNGEWQHKPVLIVREFQPHLPVNLPEALSAIQDESAGPELPSPPVDTNPTLSLVCEELGAQDQLLRNIHFNLGTKAMRFAIRTAGVSRYKSCYTTDSNAMSTQFDQETSGFTTDFELANLALCDLNGDLPSDDSRVIWLPATEQPPRPDLKTPAAELVSRQIVHCNKKKRKVIEHVWSIRVMIKRGSWFKSGEGELLGVALMPEDLVDQEVAADATNRPQYGFSNGEFERSDNVRRLGLDLNGTLAKDLSKLVTGWGVDPATHAGHLEPVMSASCFNRRITDSSGIILQEGWVEKRPFVPLPFQFDVGEPPATQTVNVSVIGYLPELDPSTGDRYVDFDLQPIDVDSPFIRLCLVRFQPHALVQNKESRDLSLSSQVTLDPIQLPSSRRVTAEWETDGLSVTITGPAYSRRSPMAPKDINSDEALEAVRHKTDVPWMRIRVMRRVFSDPNKDVYIQAADETGVELEATVPSVPSGHVGNWSAKFAIKPRKEEYRVFVEEIEFYPAEDLLSGELVLSEVPRAFKCDISI
jgi:hypothetical protein